MTLPTPNTPTPASRKRPRTERPARHQTTPFWTVEGFVRNQWRLVAVEDSYQKACYLASIMVRWDQSLEDRVRIRLPSGKVC